MDPAPFPQVGLTDFRRTGLQAAGGRRQAAGCRTKQKQPSGAQRFT